MVLLVIAAVIRETSANEGFDSIGNTEAAVDDSFTQFDEFGDGEAIGDFADERSFATEEQALAADAAEAISILNLTVQLLSVRCAKLAIYSSK